MRTVVVTVRTTTTIDDDTEDDETDNRKDLDYREDKFGFSVASDTKEVDGYDDNEEDGDPNTGVDILCARPEV